MGPCPFIRTRWAECRLTTQSLTTAVDAHGWTERYAYDIEVWQLSDDPKATVTYRPFGRSGGAAIDHMTWTAST